MVSRMIVKSTLNSPTFQANEKGTENIVFVGKLKYNDTDGKPYYLYESLIENCTNPNGRNGIDIAMKTVKMVAEILGVPLYDFREVTRKVMLRMETLGKEGKLPFDGDISIDITNDANGEVDKLTMRVKADPD